MQLWIGLGNPSTKYAGNRHNAGFMAVDALAEHYRAASWSKKFNALITEINIDLPTEQGEARSVGVAGGRFPLQKIILLKPQQFMNLSGQAVGEAMRFYKLSPADITVFHDELDLPLGKLRVKTGGGHGGHNGLKDIAAHIGQEYRRVRLGIGHPGDKDLVSPYVLSDFAAVEHKTVQAWWQKIVAEAPLLAAGKDAEFMTRMAG